MMRVRAYFDKLEKLVVNTRKTVQHEAGITAYTANSEIKDAEINEATTDVLSHKQIPGPRSFPLIGNIFRFMPPFGKYSGMQMSSVLKMLRDEYGNIVRLNGIPNRRPTVFLFSPELCEKVYRVQGIWPQRIAMESLHYYHESRSVIYGGLHGLTTSQGKQWHDFRTKVNQHMMQPRVVVPHVEQVNDIADEFIAKIRKLRSTETLKLPSTFKNEINKWALESICSIALDHRLGCLKEDFSENSEQQMIINSAHEMFEMMYRLEIEPSLWKLYATADLKRLFRAIDTLNGVAIKYVNQAKAKIAARKKEDKTGGSVLEKLLGVDEQIARVMALDMLAAGVDTTGNTASALLYYLASNTEKQEKLRKEIMTVLPTKSSPVTPNTLNEIPYLKACMKESARLFPIAIGTLRTMPTDVIFDKYRIPKGYDLIACHGIISQDPAHFPRADEFIPERWLRDDTECPLAKEAHRFSFMPFGFGSRSCIGKRFAELQLQIITMKMIRNFKMEWHEGPMECRSRMINTVVSPLKFKLIDL